MANNNMEEIVGIDHGYKNMKTRNCTFPTAISEITQKPDELIDILEFNGRYYTIAGEQVSSVENRDKSDSEEFYLLTLVALAKELKTRNRTGKGIKVMLDCGLPYKWYANQKQSFKEKLLSNSTVEFRFEGIEYGIEFVGARIFMQGVSAITTASAKYMSGYYILVDIGGETVDIIPIEDGKVLSTQCRIITKASISIMNEIVETIQTELFETMRINEIIEIIKTGKIDENDPYEKIVKRELQKYSHYIYKSLKEFGFNTERSNIVFVGGGSLIIRNFGEYNEDKTDFITDLNANAKGYEKTEMMIQKRRKA